MNVNVTNQTTGVTRVVDSEQLKQEMLDAWNKPITEPQLFVVGQTVRVLSTLTVNMPKGLDYWLGAKCKVERVVSYGIFVKEWSYDLKHPNGQTCEFKGHELDSRYINKSKKVVA